MYFASVENSTKYLRLPGFAMPEMISGASTTSVVPLKASRTIATPCNTITWPTL